MLDDCLTALRHFIICDELPTPTANSPPLSPMYGGSLCLQDVLLGWTRPKEEEASCPAEAGEALQGGEGLQPTHTIVSAAVQLLRVVRTCRHPHALHMGQHLFGILRFMFINGSEAILQRENCVDVCMGVACRINHGGRLPVRPDTNHPYPHPHPPSGPPNPY